MKNKIMLSVGENLTITKGYEQLRMMKQAEGLKPDTIRYYDDCFKYFKEYAGEQTLCEDLNQDMIINYIFFLRSEKKVNDVSINTYIRGIRTIINYFIEREYTYPFKIKGVKAVKSVKETYSDDELNRLLEKPNIKKVSFPDYRNWVIVCYLLGTGNRANTICNLKIENLDFSGHQIILKVVKNAKQYIIPMSPTLEKVLKEYLSYRKGAADDYLFCNQYGEQLTREGLKTCIQRYNKSRGVEKSSLHLFRHTFAKKWILNKGDIFRLQSILGHSSIDIVKEYVNMFGVDLQKDFSVFNPLDTMDCMKPPGTLIKM
ncbi:MAG: tyrosine-type recombinase/integrase [Oscillospiraceae bacterium]|nr:tyrosine-type recombinase/integrase [Oscillospiraceae bacterium]